MPWNGNLLSTETLFVIDFKVNRLFGLIDKERLTNFHQELMRYTIDADDKEWLIEQKILLPVHRNFRIMLLVLDEVKKLAQNDKYRGQTMDKMNQLIGFKIPEFMLKKIRMVFHDLQKKSENLLSAPSLTGMQSNIIPQTTTITVPISAESMPVTSSLSSNPQSSVIIIETSSGNNFVTSKPNDNISSTTNTTNRNLLRSSYATLSALLGSTSKDDVDS